MNPQFLYPKQCRQQGFTLIEVMVVIVIMGIVVSLIVINIQGVDQRRTMQVKDQFALELQKIARESVDQAKVLGLKVYPATDVRDAQYEVFELATVQDVTLQNPLLAAMPSQARYTWQPSPLFRKGELPAHVNIVIEQAQQTGHSSHQFNLRAASTQLPLQEMQMLWLGNGEVQASTIHFYYAQQSIGSPLHVDYLGRVQDE